MDDATQKLVDEAHGWCPACGGSGMVMEFEPTDCPNLAVHRALEAAQRPPVAPAEPLGFVIDDAEVLTWGDGGCRPASSTEIALWNTLRRRPPVGPEVVEEGAQDE